MNSRTLTTISQARIGRRQLPAVLAVPERPIGMVVFAHGSGSSRFSPRNQFVAHCLQQAGLATLLIDLLSERESSDRYNVFDIPLLAERVVESIEWTHENASTAELPVGIFGASTGAAAALVAAARRPELVKAVVSRGGRPDLAGDDLSLVQAPTLLIVGGRDRFVQQLNRQAIALLHCPATLRVVPGATHLFTEPETLHQVAVLAADWFSRHLPIEHPEDHAHVLRS